MEQRMSQKKTLQSRNQASGIMHRFIFIRGVGFPVQNDIGMLAEEIFIIKVGVSDNTQSVCDNVEFVSIKNMPVNVELFDFRISRCIGRHRAVSGFVWVIAFIKVHGFAIGFELFDDSVGVFEIIFRNPGLNAGKIKDSHRGFNRINMLADGLSNVNQEKEEIIDIIQKLLFKTGDFGGIRNFIKIRIIPEDVWNNAEKQAKGNL